eukprot:Sdes_comp20751_c0_seq1m16673
MSEIEERVCESLQDESHSNGEESPRKDGLKNPEKNQDENVNMDPIHKSTTKCCLCENQPKYKCPRCEKQTCSLDCVKNHKQLFSCSGKRNRTEFIPISEYSASTFFSDFTLLEEISRFSDQSRRDQLLKRHKIPEGKFSFLVKASKMRDIQLKIMPISMKKHRMNSSFFHIKENLIYWKLELHFFLPTNLLIPPNRNQENILSLEIEKISEIEPLGKILDKILDKKSPHLSRFQNKNIPQDFLIFFSPQGKPATKAGKMHPLDLQ